MNTTLTLVPAMPLPEVGSAGGLGNRRAVHSPHPRRAPGPLALRARLQRWLAVPLRVRFGRLRAEERGAVTAEYAIVILAAVAFAGLLVAIMQSAEIRAMLVQLVENALGEGL